MDSKDTAGDNAFPPLPGLDGFASGGGTGMPAADPHSRNIRPQTDSEPDPLILPGRRMADDGLTAPPPLRDLPGMDSDPDMDAGSGPEFSDDASPIATTRKHSKDPLIGQTFARYVILEAIGQGGMGMVYKARQASLDRLVAIKMLNKALVDNEEFIRRFEREAKAMAHLHHPNIVSVIDFGDQDGVWFMVAEFVEGTNLSRMIRQQLIVPPSTLLPIMVQCLSGLDYVARSGVVHRDIKPDNILIDKAGTAKIADFGLAKDFSKEETDLTAAGSAMGTPAYMSPEQCMGRPLDVRSDIYAFGVTAYYALTGEKPFTGQSSFEIMTKQREYDPPPVHQVNPQVPKAISALVAKMLAKRPGERHQNAEECRDAWLAVGRDLGMLASVTRSGEFFFVDPHAADKQRQAEPPALGVNYPDSLPQRGGEGILPELRNQPLPPPAPLAPAVPPPVPESERIPTPSAKPRTTGSGSHERPSNLAKSVAPAVKAAVAASKTVNTPEPPPGKTASTRYAGKPPTLEEAEQHQRAGRWKQAAEVFGRLAEQESDRRQRSILRTKERDARTRAGEQGSSDLNNAVQGMVEQGQFKAALRTLEGARSASASTVSDKRYSQEILRLRALLQQRRRRVRLIVLAVVLVLSLTGWLLFREQVGALLRRLVVPSGQTEVGAP